jgi:protein-S-isoprenylcysteine O-methyltransferase Ste14
VEGPHHVSVAECCGAHQLWPGCRRAALDTGRALGSPECLGGCWDRHRLGLFIWSGLVNPFFSPEVRIQADVGQRVISEGPYAIVRHPGYATGLLYVFAAGLALNSLLSIIPAIIYAAITVRVTAIEDQMLRDELAGYSDYAAIVRYRLIPGIW